MFEDQEFGQLCVQLRKYLLEKKQVGIVLGVSVQYWDISSPVGIKFTTHAGSYRRVINPEMLRLKDLHKGSTEWSVYRLPSNYGRVLVPGNGANLKPETVLYIEIDCAVGE